jgi:hypothetical protein
MGWNVQRNSTSCSIVREANLQEREGRFGRLTSGEFLKAMDGLIGLFKWMNAVDTEAHNA